MKNPIALLAMLTLLLLAGSCTKNDVEDSPINTADIGAATATSIISSVAATTVSTLPPSREGIYPELWDDFSNLLEPESSAAVTSCYALPYADQCNNKVKSATYTNCMRGADGSTVSGTVTLNFSAANCALPNAATITRSVNLTRTTGNKSTVNTTSDSKTDYRGNVIGGGSLLTNNGLGYSAAVSGINKVRTSSKGQTIYDMSFRTLSPMTISDGGSGVVAVTGGILEAIHNAAKYTATVSSMSLNYNFATCCYPTSGTMSLVYSGSITGAATVSFSAKCGQAVMSIDGNSATVKLPGCD